MQKPEWVSGRLNPKLTPDVEKVFLARSAIQWEKVLLQKNVCFFRVLPWREVFNEGTFKTEMEKDPLAWAGFTPNPKLRKSPRLGENTYEVLVELGITNKQISDWMSKGVIAGTT